MERNLLLIVVIIILVLVIWFAAGPRSYYTEVHTNPILHRIHKKFCALNPEYCKVPLRAGDSAYTTNKSEITICTHDPVTKKQYEECVLDYVAFHELSHMISADYGHGPEFTRNFGRVLRAAADKGLYDPNCVIPSNYCGINN